MSASVVIYDAAGRPFPSREQRAAERARHMASLMLGTGGYAGARSDKKSLKTWYASSGSADSDSIPDLRARRARSRDLRRNAPIATGAFNTADGSVVGCGLQVKSVIDREFLKLDDETADAWEDQAERLWRYQAAGKLLDVEGELDDVGMSRIVFGSTLDSGDCFSLRRFVERPGELLGTRVQIIEADRVETPADLKALELAPRTDSRHPPIRSGIEYDPNGRPTAYWIRKQHPGESVFGMHAPSSEFTRIAARNVFDDRMVLHHYDKLRPDQSRGIPWLAPVIEPLKQLERYTEAELAAAVISAYFTVFVRSEGGEGLARQQDTSGAADEINLKPAGVFDLLPGQDISTANPGRPNDKFQPFVLAVLEQVGVALSLPFEVLVKHYTASYSAAQAAMLEAWRFFKARRRWLVATAMQPYYEWVIEESVLRGYLSAPGFHSDPLKRAAYLGTEWTGDPRGHIDPTKETTALGDKADRMWITDSEATTESSGGDWERKLRRKARELRLKKKLFAGLEDMLPQPTPTGANPAPEPERDDDEQENAA